jgi:outer membrane protein OmpU
MAEMGVVGGKAYGDVTQFWTDIDVTFSMSDEADNGLTFGAKVDLDENNAFSGTSQGGETIFIAYGPAKLTMGDTDGAFDAAMQEVGIGGSIDDAHTGHVGFSGFDGTYGGQIATFQYSFDSFTGYLSTEIDDTGTGDPVLGLGVAYSGDLGGLTLGVGLGYQTTDTNGGVAGGGQEIWGISLSTSFNNGLQAILNYSSESRDAWAADEQYTAIGLGYTMNALTIGFNYGVHENHAGVSGDTDDGFGLAVNYDLGGGLAVQFGYGKSNMENGGVKTENDQFSLGLAMSF